MKFSTPLTILIVFTVSTAINIAIDTRSLFYLVVLAGSSSCASINFLLVFNLIPGSILLSLGIDAL